MNRRTRLISGDGPDYFTPPRPATNTVTEAVLADTAFAHDANGNLTADASFFYQYDKADRLTNVIARATGARVFSATYDPLGRRREVVRADGTIDRYVYFPGSFLVLAVLDETNAVKEFYTHGPDLGGDLDTAGGIGGLLACTFAATPSAPLYYHSDPMGNVLALTDAAGSLDSSFHYTPFGRLSSRLGPHLPRFLFSSEEFDMEVFLSYYGYRYLSHKTGRWTTRDPLASVPLQFAFHQTNSNKFLGNNLYVLIDNSPTMRIDPYGLCPKCPNGSKVRVSTGWTGCPQEYRTNQQRSSIIETNGCGSKDSAWVPDSFSG